MVYERRFTSIFYFLHDCYRAAKKNKKKYYRSCYKKIPALLYSNAEPLERLAVNKLIGYCYWKKTIASVC